MVSHYQKLQDQKPFTSMSLIFISPGFPWLIRCWFWLIVMLSGLFLSQGITDTETLTTRLKAFHQKNRIKNIDDHMDRIYWEDQVEQAMKQTTRNLEQ